MNHRAAFLSFVLIGGLATLLHYLILIALVRGMGMDAVLASTIGFALSTLLNYSLNYRYTYRSQKSHAEAFPKFVLVAGLGLVLNSTMMWIAVHTLAIHYIVAQIASTGIVMFWNFFANLLWSFRERVASGTRTL